jgi:thioredoxin 1
MPQIESPLIDPDLKQLFLSPELTASNFDAIVLRPENTRLQLVYFWGDDCPNCVVAKDHMTALERELKEFPIDIRSVNAYEHMDLTTRYGLFGIPVFLLFKKGRLVGKITSFPTRAEFLAVLKRYV